MFGRIVRGDDLILITQIAIAAGASWLVNVLLLNPSVPPFSGALVPLLALERDPLRSTLTIIKRVFGVLVGVAIGYFAVFIAAPGLWSALLVAVLVFVTLAIGKYFVTAGMPSRQVAISALITYGMTQINSNYGQARIGENLLGGAMTILVAIVAWPPNPEKYLRGLTSQLVRDLSQDLATTGTQFPPQVDDGEPFFMKLRNRSRKADADSAMFEQGSHALRLNPRRFTGSLQRIVELQVRYQYASSMYLHLLTTTRHFSELARSSHGPGEERTWAGIPPLFDAMSRSLMDLEQQPPERGALEQSVSALIAVEHSSHATLSEITLAGLRQLVADLDKIATTYSTEEQNPSPQADASDQAIV